MSSQSPSPAPLHGLSEASAQARLKAEGYNELPQSDRRTALRIFFEVVREPMFALLLGGGVIYLALGDLKEAIILLVFATFSVVITVVQETRTEGVLEALRELTSPRALVIRDGERKRIAGRDVVRGDIIVLQEGDRVPADALLTASQDLQTDESLLTGESLAVRKRAADGDVPSRPIRPGGDDLPYVFSGTLVVRGTGIGEVTATGLRSEIGKIGRSLSTLESEPPRLQGQIRQLVGVFAVVGGAVSLLAVLLYGVLRGGWLKAVLAGIALGMSMLPEEFPVVLTVFMAMGAWRISRARVLTRRATAIEALGSATVLCTDKTGTLTENWMSVAELRLKSDEIFRPAYPSGAQVPAHFRKLVEYGVMASEQDPFDPMEKAFHALPHAFAGVRISRRLGMETRACLWVEFRASGAVECLAAQICKAGLRHCGERCARSHCRSLSSRSCRMRRAAAIGGCDGARGLARLGRGARDICRKKPAGVAA